MNFSCKFPYSKTRLIYPICFLVFFSLLLCIISAAPLRAQVSKPFIIKFATVAPEGSTWIKQMRKIALQIKHKSKGRLLFRIYAGGVAGDEPEVLNKIRFGQLQCAAFSGVGFGKILPEVRVLDLPFLFNSYGEVDKVLRTLWPYFFQRFKEKGFILLSWAEVGNVYVFSKKPIRRAKDFKRSRPWSWAGDPIAKETFHALGVSPVSLPVTDVTTALATGMVDTVYAPPLGLLALQWQPYVKYMNRLPFAHSTGALLLTMRLWDRLPRDLKDLLSSEFRKNLATLNLELRRQNQEAIKVLENQGITIIPAASGVALKEFEEIRRRVASVLCGKIYPPSLLNRVYEIIGKK